MGCSTQAAPVATYPDEFDIAPGRFSGKFRALGLRTRTPNHTFSAAGNFTRSDSAADPALMRVAAFIMCDTIAITHR